MKPYFKSLGYLNIQELKDLDKTAEFLLKITEAKLRKRVIKVKRQR